MFHADTTCKLFSATLLQKLRQPVPLCYHYYYYHYYHYLLLLFQCIWFSRDGRNKMTLNNQQWELLYEVCSRTLNHAPEGAGVKGHHGPQVRCGGSGGVDMNLRRSRWPFAPALSLYSCSHSPSAPETWGTKIRAWTEQQTGVSVNSYKQADPPDPDMMVLTQRKKELHV